VPKSESNHRSTVSFCPEKNQPFAMQRLWGGGLGKVKELIEARGEDYSSNKSAPVRGGLY